MHEIKLIFRLVNCSYDFASTQKLLFKINQMGDAYKFWTYDKKIHIAVSTWGSFMIRHLQKRQPPKSLSTVMANYIFLPHLVKDKKLEEKIL